MSRMHNPSHPGEVLLEDYLKPLGMSARTLSIALCVPYSCIRAIVNGKRGVTAEIALRLERYFGSEAQGWLALQAAHDLSFVEREVGEQIKLTISPLVQDIQALKGKFTKPEHPVSVEAMNQVIASRGAMSALSSMHNPPHPGEVLREYMGNMTVTYLANIVGVEYSLLASLLAGTGSVTPDLANRLAQALGTSVDIWIGMQQKYDSYDLT